MKPKLIIFVGMPGSGKSICVEYLKNKGLKHVYFGGITLNELKRRGLEINPQNEKIVREDIRRKKGNDAYALEMIDEIKNLVNEKIVVVDGLYSWTEYKIFKSTYGDNAIVIGVIAPRNIRHERLNKRIRRPLNEKEASERDYSEIEHLEKGGPIANADYYLTNTDDVSTLTRALDTLLSKLNITI